MMGNGKLFLGGVPTAPDVRALRDKYGVPDEGTLITYDEVAALLKITVGSHRFKTVTNTWRRALLREHNVMIGTRSGIGFIVLAPIERSEWGGSKIRQGVRAVERAHHVIETTDRARLTAEQLLVHDHNHRCSGAFLLAAKAEARRPVVELPPPVANN